MRITKFGHACVRIETEGSTIVIDPGCWTEREVVDGATALLVTHEHADHLDADNLRASDAPVYTIGAVVKQLNQRAPDLKDRLNVVARGNVLDLGVPVTVLGEKHAVIHPLMPQLDNSGYLIEAEGRHVYHPGDAFTLPEASVDLLLLPVHAPWSKTSEVVEFARAVNAPQVVAIHDGLLNHNGLSVVKSLLSGLLSESEHEYFRVAPGEDVALC